MNPVQPDVLVDPVIPGGYRLEQIRCATVKWPYPPTTSNDIGSDTPGTSRAELLVKGEMCESDSLAIGAWSLLVPAALAQGI